ncbi:MAG TPA: AAA family ATPase [Baekduia sp.]|nr:AAA family ATPase [Baekduia sp.]
MDQIIRGSRYDATLRRIGGFTMTEDAGALSQSPTVERGEELAAINGLLRGVREHGAMLVIEGPMGVGKSHLLDLAAEQAESEDFTVLRASGGEFERDYPLAVVFALFESYHARATPAERRDLFRGRAALVEQLLTGTVDTSVRPRTPEEFTLLHGLHWCVVNLAERGPLALIIDDVQWADDLSLRFLTYLVQRLHGLPVALTAALNTSDPAARSESVNALVAAAQMPTLFPAPLSVDGVGRLIRESGITTATDELVADSWQVTQGNPFLVQALVDALRTNENEILAGGRSELALFAPESVRRRVLLRVTGLGRTALALARACAVLGHDASLKRAAVLAELEPSIGLDAADALEAAHVIAAGEVLGFTHPMIRSAVYRDLTRGERARLHTRAARLLYDAGAAPDRTGRHLLAGVHVAEPWAWEALGDAARDAIRKGAPAAAVRLLRHALESEPSPAFRPRLLLDLGLAEAAAGEIVSLEHFHAAVELLDEPRGKADALYALGQTLYRYGRQDEAAVTFRRGIELFDESSADLKLRFEAAYTSSVHDVAPLIGPAEASLAGWVGGLGDRRTLNGAERTMLANHAFFRAMRCDPADQVAALARRALGDGELLRAETSESIVVYFAIGCLLYCGHFGEAEAAVEEALADARRRGSGLAFAEGSQWRAMLRLAQGRTESAMFDAQVAIDGMERGWRSGVPVPQAIIAECLIERGDLDGAADVLRNVEDYLPQRPTAGLHAWYFVARAMLHNVRGAHTAALDDVQIAEELRAPFGPTNPAMLSWAIPGALAARGTGDLGKARRFADGELALARRFGAPALLGRALRVSSLTGDGPGDLETLREAVAVLENSGAQLELAKALLDLGRVLRHQREPASSREHLRRAMDLAHQCGAARVERMALDELLASGARPRRTALTGPSALTPSERRVVELVARGMTSRAIAETLFLTKNTVDWHCHNVYQKLGVRSREELRQHYNATTASARSDDSDV